MTLYEGEVLDWNWIRSYGIAKITKVVGDNDENPMIDKEIFLSQSFKSAKTDANLKKTDLSKQDFDVEFFKYPKLWFEKGEIIRFKITKKGLAYDIDKLELD